MFLHQICTSLHKILKFPFVDQFFLNSVFARNASRSGDGGHTHLSGFLVAQKLLRKIAHSLFAVSTISLEIYVDQLGAVGVAISSSKRCLWINSCLKWSFLSGKILSWR
ncbi:hypothetical protein L596_009405 [Steinernema carpocapsae]|uniref:Uncharacterized protein n=1 Tax=Steinernema carpocapsae TaxID=34508 RepID=A0A4U5PF92_STECR|nr:hypothetical protein L596_009405 [Steinernema carpocapsae]